MPASADKPARTGYLLPGELDTDSEEDHNLTAEELIQSEARRLEERAATRAAAQQTLETQNPTRTPHNKQVASTQYSSSLGKSDSI